jgi:hypothetical protein
MTTMVARRTHDRPPLELRLLIRVLFGIPITVLVGFGLVLLAGIVHAGDYATLLGPPPIDPKDAIPFGFHAWNPLTWLYHVIMLAVAVGWPLAGMFSIIGVVNLGRPSVLARRRTWLLILAGVATCALFTALMFSPLVTELMVWFQD